MKKWNDLSMRERAAFIRVGVSNGLYNINDIHEAYNRFEDGGTINSTNEKEWLSNWMTERKDILNKNYGNTSDSPLNTIVSNITNTKEFVPKSFEDTGGEDLKDYVLRDELNSRKEGYSIITGQPVETVLGSASNYDSFLSKKRDIIKNARANNIDTETAKRDINKTFNDMFESSANLSFDRAKQIGFQGLFQPDKQSIIYTNYEPTTRIHELSHSMGGKDNFTLPIQKEIGTRIKLKEGVDRNYYLDNPDEIYSRLMQIRHDANLSPKDKIDIDTLNKIKSKKDIKNNSMLKDNFFDRYTDDSLIDIFNNVAMNNIPLDYGTELYKYKNYLG